MHHDPNLEATFRGLRMRLGLSVTTAALIVGVGERTVIDMRDGSSSFAMVEHDKNTLYLIKDKQTKKVYAGDYTFA